MSVDNFNKIKSLLSFKSEDEFYFVQILQRKKDHKDGSPVAKVGSNNSSRLIKSYFIYSVEQLDQMRPEIVEVCKTFNARAGINLNSRNTKEVALEMMERLVQTIRSNNQSSLHRLYNTVCGQHYAGKDNVWIIDVDHTNMRDINSMIAHIEQNLQPIGLKFKALIPSKAGFHIITSKFDSHQFGIDFPGVELHKNNPTNLYIP